MQISPQWAVALIICVGRFCCKHSRAEESPGHVQEAENIVLTHPEEKRQKH